MELTPRAAVFGVVLGALLAAGNVYMGLRTGFWETGIVTATVISAAVLPVLGRRFDPVEITLVQSVATSTGAVPAAAGLLGAVPGLALLGVTPPTWTVMLLGLGAGGLGLILAHGLRRRLLEEEQLPFPSGIAAAEVLRAQGGSGARALGISGALSAALTALREVGLWPTAFLAPARAGALGVGVAVSPMLLAAGALFGLGSALAIAIGAGVAWLGIAPALVRAGLVQDGSFASVASWLLWPGVGLMLGGGAASLARDVRAFRRGASDLRVIVRGAARSRTLGSLALVPVALIVVAARWGFSTGTVTALVALVPALLAAVACARVAGRTDVSPAGEVGQGIQAGAGVFGASPGASTGAGAIAAGVASQLSSALWSLRAGARLGVAPGAQARAHLLGLLAGAVTSVPVYSLFVGAHGLGSDALPAPTALRWRALAELVGGGGLPASVGWALVAGVMIGFIAEIGTRGRRWFPPSSAIGLGFLIPAHYAGAMLAGALIAAAASRAGRGGLIEPIAAGAIVGESMMALIAVALGATGALS